MRAWSESEPRRDGDPERRAAEERAAEERAAVVKDLEAAGIDLDPSRHDGRHGSEGQPPDSRDEPSPPRPEHDSRARAHPHPHPHARTTPGGHPVTGIVGAGAVGTALGVALARAGWPIAAVTSRDAARRDRFTRMVPGTKAFAEPAAIVDAAELIVLCVPDDQIGQVAGQLRMYSGQAMVHTSGALGAEVLAPAMAAGTQIGGFHPLVAFADIERAVASLRGAAVAIEGDDQLAGLLAEMAEALGAVPVRLLPGSKAAYHAAAVLAAGGFVALLDAITELGRVAGLDEAGALAIYGPLIEQTLGNARALGVRAALTGPVTRGDVGTLGAHLAALRTHAPGVLDLYRAAAEREIALAEARASLTPERATQLRELLAREG